MFLAHKTMIYIRKSGVDFGADNAETNGIQIRRDSGGMMTSSGAKQVETTTIVAKNRLKNKRK